MVGRHIPLQLTLSIILYSLHSKGKISERPTCGSKTSVGLTLRRQLSIMQCNMHILYIIIKLHLAALSKGQPAAQGS